MLHILRNFWPTLLLIGTILFLSLTKVQAPPSLPLFPHIDKVAHFLMYLALSYTFLFDITRSYTHGYVKKLPVALSFTFATLIGILVELGQKHLTEGRQAELADGLANMAGAFCGALLGWATIRLILQILPRFMTRTDHK